MSMYRKKPVIIEAEEFTGNGQTLSAEFRSQLCTPPCAVGGFRYDRGELLAHIDTLEGPMQVSLGDWIIRGVKGEFYPCKPDIFAATYEEVVR
jgi:hypothetical protein